MGWCWPRIVHHSLGGRSSRRRDNSDERRRSWEDVSSFSAARERFCCKSAKRRVAMKTILGILAAVAVVLILIWGILESREGGSSSYASQPETPAPQQAAGASFSYNFDSDVAGTLPTKFHSARTGKGAESKWGVMADPTAPSTPNVVAQRSN